MRDLLVASRYLTVLPLPRSAASGELGRAAGWFPVVGLVVGGCLALAATGASLVAPPAVAAVLVVALWAGLTGGLHLDGLGDAVDGLGGGWSRDEALAIMREGGIGPYGVTAIVLVLALKLTVLETISDALLWRAVIVAPMLGRLAPLALARVCPPARVEGAGHAFVLAVGTPSLIVAWAVAAFTTLGLIGRWGALLLAATGLGAILVAVYLTRRLGGLTGDCLGALIEGTEAGTLALLGSLEYLGAL